MEHVKLSNIGGNQGRTALFFKYRFRAASALLVIGQILLAGVADALAPKQSDGVLESLTFVSESLQASPQSEAFDDAHVAADDSIVWNVFRQKHGRWNAVIDKRTGKFESATGKGIPFASGSGNNQPQITNRANDFGDDPKVDLATMEAVTRAFLPEVVSLVGVNPSTLILNRDRSGRPADYLRFVDFDVTLDGMVIEGARVVFRVNNGNLVQFGTENLPAKGVKAPEVKVTRNQALTAVAAYIGGFSAADFFLDGGSQRLIPIALADNRFADGFEPGKGRGLARVWQFVFQRDDDRGTWRVRIDATSGKILEFRDITEYATAQATRTVMLLNGAQIRPMPFADFSSGSHTNSTGVYNYALGTLASNLRGQSVKIIDACGWINLPGLPFPLTTDDFPDSTGIDGVCNAFLQNAALKGSSGCSNSGEIQDGALSEYGHGPDANDDTDPTVADKGKGETHVDWSATATSSRSSAKPTTATTVTPADRPGAGRSWTGSGTSPAPSPPQRSPDSGTPRPGSPVGSWENPPF